MVRIYRCDHDTSEELRNRQINEIRAELAAKLINDSQLPTTGAFYVVLTTKKVRNRSKEDTRDRYIISGRIDV